MTTVPLKSEQKTILVATDLDGTYGHDVFHPKPPSSPTLCISGRTFAEYNDKAKSVACAMPLYIRGIGREGDAHAAGEFKAKIITLLGVSHFLEDDAIQAAIIRERCPNVQVCMVIA